MTRCSGISPRRLLLAIAAIVLVGGMAYGAGAALLDALVYLLPALLLLLVLVTRSYPGERTLLALIERKHHRRCGAGAELVSGSRSLRALLPRGGRLIASSLAERPPPVLAAVSLI